MATYGDMVTLLLTFFVMLTAVAHLSSEHLKLALGSIREYLGVTPEELEFIRGRRKTLLDGIITKLKDYGTETYGIGAIEVKVTPEGIIVEIKSPILFEKGRAYLKPAAYPVLERVTELVPIVNPAEIEIGGFTCDIPIHTRRFPSNWELSIARSLSVVKALKSKWLPDMNIIATGYSEYRPKVPNTCEDNRKLNRMVEIYLRYGKKRQPPSDED